MRRTNRPKPATQKRAKQIGIIAEDKSDVDVLDKLIGKITNTKYSIKYFAAGGCGKMIGKCHSWAQNLRDRGCHYLLLARDLDDDDLASLNASLAKALYESPIKTHLIVIPVKEIESWLLADPEAIQNAMSLKKKLATVRNTEAIRDPKKYLGHLIFINSGHTRRYVNAIHNEKIAAECSFEKLRRCASFEPFYQFISKHV